MMPAPSPSPRLSLCLIVRNEAQTLARCLSHARPFVDEIVVVDTGSTDGTQEIARRYADVFEEIEWPDSFSTARNYSFDRASGDYILYLDGDEYVPDPAHWKSLRETLREGDVAAVQVPVRNLLGEEQVLAADRGWQERVFANHVLVRFEGRVHNQVHESLGRFMRHSGRRLVRLAFEVIHTGYALSPEQMRRKYEPRLHLLQDEYDHPRSDLYRAYYGYQLGVTYYVLQRYEDAAALFDVLDFTRLSPENAFYTRLLAAQTALKLDDPARALYHCDAMLTLNRREPVAYYMAGLALLASGRIADGLLMLLEAFDVNVASERHVRFILNPGVIVGLVATLCRKAGLVNHASGFEHLRAAGDYREEALRALIASLREGIVLSAA